ncbi:MAG: hypothetical protein KDD15_20550, partial [Lewinella sp.]|nr:hypothetical protein [Lewinella sp.]
MKIATDRFRVQPDTVVSLQDYDPAFTAEYKDANSAKRQLEKDIDLLSDLQYQLYAENRRALLIIFQAMDAAGKDGAIKHVLSGINPQGCDVHSFKHPSLEELDHD